MDKSKHTSIGDRPELRPDSYNYDKVEIQKLRAENTRLLKQQDALLTMLKEIRTPPYKVGEDIIDNFIAEIEADK